jgi:hypothetical protein
MLCGFKNINNEPAIPENILHMTEVYPETKVLIDYYKEACKDKGYYTREIDITSDLLTDDVPLFLQWDKRWAFLNYGKETIIATSACGPVCLSMVQCYFYKDKPKTPKDMAGFSYKKGFYTEKVGTSGALFLDGAYDFNLKPKVIPVNNQEIKKSLDGDKIIVALVKEGHFTVGGHYIIIKGYNENGDYLVNDPNSLINSNKAWPPEVIINESKALWAIGVN